MSDETQNPAQDAQEQQAPQFQIQRIYCKDISFETPNSPEIFTTEWKPEMKVDMDTKTKQLDANTFEVVLTVTAQANIGDKTAFLVEV